EDITAGVAWQRSQNYLALAEFDSLRSRPKCSRRICQLDRHHRVEATNLSFKLRAFVCLIFGSFAELFRSVRFPFLQFFRSRQKSFVYRRQPWHDIFMRDDWNAARNQYLIPARVIEVVVTIDSVLDWKLRERLNLPNQLFDCRRREECVEDEH